MKRHVTVRSDCPSSSPPPIIGSTRYQLSLAFPCSDPASLSLLCPTCALEKAPAPPLPSSAVAVAAFVVAPIYAFQQDGSDVTNALTRSTSWVEEGEGGERVAGGGGVARSSSCTLAKIEKKKSQLQTGKSDV
jgi:hypothetical protein